MKHVSLMFYFLIRVSFFLFMAAALLVAAVTISFYALYIHNDVLYNTSKDKVFFVSGVNDKGLKSHGSGFMVTNSKGVNFIITNRHVCENKTKITVIDHESKEYPGQIIKMNPVVDICALKAPKGFSSFTIGDIASYYYVLPIYALGYPSNNGMTLTSGKAISWVPRYSFLKDKSKEECDELKGRLLTVNGIKNTCTVMYKVVQSVVPIRGGNSGSPVLSVHGKVLGVMVARDAGYWGQFIDSSEIIKLIESI